MAFREKSAWIMATALLLGGLAYFAAVVGVSREMSSLAPPIAPLVAIYTVLLVVVAALGHIAVAVLSPHEANAPLDEREREIVTRASHCSSTVLGAGVVASLGLYLLAHDGHLLFYAVFASLMLSQLLEYVLQILHYRSVLS